MAIYDISTAIHKNMALYKNKTDRAPILKNLRTHHEGSFESEITLHLHTGTHLDAPLHMVEAGEDIGGFPLARSLSQCQVIEIPIGESQITADILKTVAIDPGVFVLFKTKNSQQEGFDPEFCYLAKDGAQYLRDLGVVGVGIDALGIERSQSNHETHHILFEKGISILEGIQLKAVPPGSYWLVLVPLNIPGAEASPVRALLWDQETLKERIGEISS